MPWGAPYPMPFFAPPFAPYWGNPYFGYGPGADVDAELEFLKGQEEYLADMLDGIRQRIEELEESKKGG